MVIREPAKKWYESRDNTGFDDRAGQTLMAWGSLGLLPGPSDVAATAAGATVARVLGMGTKAAVVFSATLAYGIPLIAIGTGFALTRLD
jgi:hypothetical protein